MIEMDTRLAEAFAHILANWLDVAAQESRNRDFYRGIVCQVGEMFGDDAKTSDDGSLQDSVLALKVPELVKKALTPPRFPTMLRKMWNGSEVQAWINQNWGR
jgi:hypothetical protein